jgi:hypothetical protein
MTYGSRFFLILLLAGLFCTPCVLRANPAPHPMSGGTVSAKWPHKTIRMDGEEVTIRLGASTYTVEGVYRMVNSGDTTTEWVGFPKNGPKMYYGMDFQDFLQFHAWVGGKKVPFTKEGAQWLAGEVTFPGHATTIIRCVYEIRYPETYKWASNDDFAEYIVGTGSLWKGNIGKAIFTVDGSAIDGTRTFDADLGVPGSHKLSADKVIRFDASNFKPERDATLYIHIKHGRKAFAR